MKNSIQQWYNSNLNSCVKKETKVAHKGTILGETSRQRYIFNEISREKSINWLVTYQFINTWNERNLDYGEIRTHDLRPDLLEKYL